MKKFLLTCLAATAFAGSALAAEPQLMYNAAFERISANGKVAVSEVYGYLIIYDLTTGKQTFFGPDEDAGTYAEYYVGNGNSITADGSIVLASENEKAIYIQNGEINTLEVPDPDKTNSFNGITPDGSRICGNVGTANMEDAYNDDVTMCAPAYWDRNADGKGYGSYNLLPAPKLDFFGRAPQYVKAIVISSDGKTIVGQVTDARGYYEYPILYQQNEKGEWSYSLPTEKYFNPDNIPAVEYPGESPEYPDPTAYMSGERKEAYQTAYDNNEWPNAEDYMTDAEKAAYEKAKEQYQAEYEAWDEKDNVYNDYYFEVVESSPSFLTNNAFLSTDGKEIASTLCRTVENPDPLAWMPWINVYTPCTIDIATCELTVVDTEISCAVSCVADNGIILANNERGAIPMTGYVIKDGNVQTIDAYIAAISPSYGEWINKNMTHEVVTYVLNEETEEWDEEYSEVLFTGKPIATPDMSIITFWNDRAWDDSYEYFVESAIFEMPASAGISTVAATNKDLTVDENGNIKVPAGFESVQVYNISGACVKNAAAPEGTIELNLANGVYVVKGKRNDGSVSIIKISK